MASEYTASKMAADDALIKHLIERGGFLGRYIKYGRELTDAPSIYHLGTGLTLLSTITNQKVLVDLRQEGMYTNVWVILLGASTTSRKSTAIDIAMDLVRDIVPLFPSEFSAEALIRKLEQTPSGIYVKDEFGGFLRGMKQKDDTKKDLLCTVFNCPKRLDKELVSYEVHAEKLYLVILAATTVRRFQENIDEEDIYNGFGARFLYIIPNRKEKWMGIGHKTKEQERLKKELSKLLKKAAKRVGGRQREMKLRFSDDALDTYNGWLKKHQDELMKLDNEEELSSFYGRLEQYVIKITMLLWVDDLVNSVIRYSANSVLTEEHVETAIKIVEVFGQHSARVAEEMSKNKKLRVVDRIKSIIEKHGTMSHSKLLKNSNLDARELKLVISTLEERDEIVINGQGKGKEYTYVG